MKSEASRGPRPRNLRFLPNQAGEKLGRKMSRGWLGETAPGARRKQARASQGWMAGGEPPNRPGAG